MDASNIHNDAQGTGAVRMLNASGLDDGEFLMWGHNNGILKASETVDVPAGVEARFDRVWRASEVNTYSSGCGQPGHEMGPVGVKPGNIF